MSSAAFTPVKQNGLQIATENDLEPFRIVIPFIAIGLSPDIEERIQDDNDPNVNQQLVFAPVDAQQVKFVDDVNRIRSLFAKGVSSLSASKKSNAEIAEAIRRFVRLLKRLAEQEASQREPFLSQQREVEILRVSVEELRKQLSEEQSKLVALQAELDSCDSERDRLRQEVAGLDAVNRELATKQNVENLLKTCEDEKKKTVQRLQQRIADLERRLEEALKDEAGQRDAKDNISQELRVEREKVAVLNKNVKDLQTQLERQRKCCEELETLNERLKEDERAQRKDATILEGETNDLQREVDALRQQLQDEKKRADQLEKALESDPEQQGVTIPDDPYKDTIQLLQNQVDTLEKQLAELRERCQEQEFESEDKEEELKKKQKEIEELQEDKQELFEEAKRLQDENTQLDEVIEEVIDNNQALQDAALEESERADENAQRVEDDPWVGSKEESAVCNQEQLCVGYEPRENRSIIRRNTLVVDQDSVPSEIRFELNNIARGRDVNRVDIGLLDPSKRQFQVYSFRPNIDDIKPFDKDTLSFVLQPSAEPETTWTFQGLQQITVSVDPAEFDPLSKPNGPNDASILRVQLWTDSEPDRVYYQQVGINVPKWTVDGKKPATPAAPAPSTPEQQQQQQEQEQQQRRSRRRRARTQEPELEVTGGSASLSPSGTETVLERMEREQQEEEEERKQETPEPAAPARRRRRELEVVGWQEQRPQERPVAFQDYPGLSSDNVEVMTYGFQTPELPRGDRTSSIKLLLRETGRGRRFCPLPTESAPGGGSREGIDILANLLSEKGIPGLPGSIVVDLFIVPFSEELQALGLSQDDFTNILYEPPAQDFTPDRRGAQLSIQVYLCRQSGIVNRFDAESYTLELQGASTENRVFSTIKQSQPRETTTTQEQQQPEQQPSTTEAPTETTTTTTQQFSRQGRGVTPGARNVQPIDGSGSSSSSSSVSSFVSSKLSRLFDV